MKTVWMLLVLCVSALYIPGCASFQKTSFGLNGLPQEQYRVGGGFSIEYHAPGDGTFYLVDVSSGKFIVTKEVSEGDSFEFSIDSTQVDEAKAVGINLEKSKLVLYFVPKPKQQ
jgi:hypothetical protein